MTSNSRILGSLSIPDLVFGHVCSLEVAVSFNSHDHI